MEEMQCPGATMYVWQAGDTVENLAERLQTTTQAIWRLNGLLNLDALQPGDEICVPPYPLACTEGTLYSVKMGDSFQSIARREGIPILSLIERNPYIDPGDLTEGEILCLPERGGHVIPTDQEYLTGTVRYAQTITDILKEYDISYEAFRIANPSLNPETLLPGQRFLIPPSGARGLCPHYSYVILNGENLTTISIQFGIPESQLLRANPGMTPGDFVTGRTICLGREYPPQAE